MNTKVALLRPDRMPKLAMPEEISARIRNMFSEAAENTSSSLPRLTFGRMTFNLSFGASSRELPGRTLDVHILAINPRFHYVFYQNKFTGTDADKEGRVMSRYPLATDPIEFPPDGDGFWAQRMYRQRCVVMIANDPSRKLYVADFGYKSVRKPKIPEMGLLNLSDLAAQFDIMMKTSKDFFPFMAKIQLSFAKDTVPVVQFSFFDQLNPDSDTIRFADEASSNAMIQMLASGEVDRLMDVTYDSGEFGAPDVGMTQPMYVGAPIQEHGPSPYAAKPKAAPAPQAPRRPEPPQGDELASL